MRHRLIMFGVLCFAVVCVYGGVEESRASTAGSSLALVHGQVARKGLFIMLTKICQTQPPLECMNKRWGEVQRLVAPHLRTIRSTDERIRSGIVQSICERLKLHTEKDCAHFGSLLITQSEAQVKAGFGPPKPPQRPEFGPQNPQNEKNKVNELITKCRESLSALAKKEVDLKKKDGSITNKMGQRTSVYTI